jgi:hypothetical protein
MGRNAKVMTLDDARVELERDGMSCEIATDQLLVGVSSRCRWETSSKMDVMVFVQKVPGVLTRERFLADLELLPSWVEEYQAGGNCPPFGAGRAHLKFLVYYADSVESGFGYEIRHAPRPPEWCAATYIAAQDAQGQSFYLAEANRPFWGRAFYPECRYCAQKLTGVPEEKLQPPVFPGWVAVVNGLCIGYLIYAIYSQHWMALFLLGAFMAQCLIAWFKQCRLKRKQQKRVGSNNCHFVDVANCTQQEDDHDKYHIV